MTVYYKGDPKQQPLELVGDYNDGWVGVQWPRGQGWTKKDLPWRMWGAQLSATPWHG